VAALPLTSGTFGAAVVVLLYNEKRQPVKGWRFGPSGESRIHLKRLSYAVLLD